MLKPLLKPLTLAAALAAAPASAETLVACWDQSFAYTHAGISDIGEGGVLVMFATQMREILRPVVPAISADWGDTYLELTFPPGACTVSEQDDLFSCAAEAVPGRLVTEAPGGERNRLALDLGTARADFLDTRGADGIARKLLAIQWQSATGAGAFLHDFGDVALCGGPWNALRE